MASKKGIIVTGIILAAITGASFLLWLVPQDAKTTFVVSDYEGYLDGVKSIHTILKEENDIKYEQLLDGTITPQEYTISAQVTTNQITEQITKFVTSKPAEPWQSSYINYMEALKSFNSYITETRVAASMIESQSSDEIEEIFAKIEMLKSESAEFVAKSDESRP